MVNHIDRILTRSSHTYEVHIVGIISKGANSTNGSVTLLVKSGYMLQRITPRGLQIHAIEYVVQLGRYKVVIPRTLTRR